MVVIIIKVVLDLILNFVIENINFNNLAFAEMIVEDISSMSFESSGYDSNDIEELRLEDIKFVNSELTGNEIFKKLIDFENDIENLNYSNIIGNEKTDYFTEIKNYKLLKKAKKK